MKIIPVLFSTPMVQGILQDRKTITRRTIKTDANIISWNSIVLNGCAGWTDEHGRPVKCKYSVGDVLWVRETWKPLVSGGSDKFNLTAYRADGHEHPGSNWRPSIFMPKAACRIFLEVTDVRPERLQDISEEDAIAEGVEALGLYPGYNVSSKGKFEGLWGLINGEESWQQNPWVWVVSFKRTEKPENFIETKP